MSKLCWFFNIRNMQFQIKCYGYK